VPDMIAVNLKPVGMHIGIGLGSVKPLLYSGAYAEIQAQMGTPLC
jgi:hypothetical protein